MVIVMFVKFINSVQISPMELLTGLIIIYCVRELRFAKIIILVCVNIFTWLVSL